MLQTIDFDTFKKNPQLFFNELPKQAETEFKYLFEYFIFRYNVVNYHKDFKTKQEVEKKNDFLEFIANNKIKLPEDFKFNREEANER